MDTPTGETGTTPTNDVATTPPAPQANAVDPRVEELKKKAEQAEMRANQLANQLKAKEEADAAAKAKELEEQNEFKSLFEQEKARNEAFVREREEAEQKAQLANTQNEVYGEFSAEVIELAKETGIGLSEISDEAKEKLRNSLTKLSEKVSSTASVSSNNPSAPSAQTDAQLIEAMRFGDRDAREKVIGNLHAVKEMRKQAGYQ